jgi:hypothetical protein
MRNRQPRGVLVEHLVVVVDDGRLAAHHPCDEQLEDARAIRRCMNSMNARGPAYAAMRPASSNRAKMLQA